MSLLSTLILLSSAQQSCVLINQRDCLELSLGHWSPVTVLRFWGLSRTACLLSHRKDLSLSLSNSTLEQRKFQPSKKSLQDERRRTESLNSENVLRACNQGRVIRYYARRSFVLLFGVKLASCRKLFASRSERRDWRMSAAGRNGI